MTLDEKKRIIKEHFKYLFIAGLEYSLVFYASKARLKKVVELKNEHYLLDHYEKEPVILLCPHFVGLDLGAICLSLDVVGFSMYSKQKSELITNRIKEARLRFIGHLGGEIFARQEGLRPIIRRLKESKRIFYYLPDQDFGERDSLYVPFFAHPTCATVNALPKLVTLTSAKVVPTIVYWDGKKYVMEFFEAWDNYPTDNLTQDVARMNQFIENVVKEHIEQYFWLHKRFKTQPDGRHKLYQEC
jgi:KDO2-lipid IV(A) lauroyltransferase